MHQRLAHLYDAICIGHVASQTIDLPNRYHTTIHGAVVAESEDALVITGLGFAIAYREADEGPYLEERLLVVWKGDQVLRDWLDAVETAYYPALLQCGNRPIYAPPMDWHAITIADDHIQIAIENWALENAAAPWGYMTRSTPDQDDNIHRLYRFSGIQDAVYAKLLA